MYSLSFFVGALVPTFIVSRIFLLILKKWDGGWKKAVFANAMSLLVATLLGAMGMANDGAFAAVSAFMGYILPQAVWLIVDLYRMRSKHGA